MARMTLLCRLWGTAAPTLAAFLIGAAGTVLGTAVAFSLLGSRLGPEGYKVRGLFCALLTTRNPQPIGCARACRPLLIGSPEGPSWVRKLWRRYYSPG